MTQDSKAFQALKEYLQIDNLPPGLIEFKQFKQKSGDLHPLFVDTKQTIPLGVWLTAEEGERKFGKVKSVLGPLSYRPGWHLSDTPYAPHIGIKEDGAIKYQRNDTVWALCVVYDHIDWTGIARQRGFNPRTGNFDPRNACLDCIPTGGYYWYTTNPSAYGRWLICERMYVVLVLTDEQVEWICWNIFGIHAQPRKAV